MNKCILIITNSADIHADIVEEKIRARSETPFRINLDEFPRDFALNLEFSQREWTGFLTHLPSDATTLISDIGAAWLRKPAAFSFKSEELAPQEKAYAGEEMEHILSGLLYGLDCYWMSHPLAVRNALWKGEQLLRAARHGFQVPASIISNHADSVRRFRSRVDGEMIFKTMATPFLAADRVDTEDRIARGIPTTRITGDDVDLLDCVEELPCLFQKYIPKSHELRVTIIGDEVFAARIHSQDDERTRTDWRDFSAGIPYERAELPSNFERKCREFVRSYGLNFGAMDFIVTPAGEYVFLENNPAGQFLFVEQLVPELKMTDAVATHLIEGAGRGR